MAFILYKKDLLENRAMIHWNTTNKSFIRMSMVLKRMGIQNHYFFLALLQPELEHVNPYANDLDERTKARIIIECKYNPWYFFRECLKVPAAGGTVSDFLLHRGNLAAIWSFLNDIDFGLIMPRQTGKTYVSQSIIAYLLYVLADHITIGHFDKDTPNCANIIRAVKDLRDGMPKWMYQKTAQDTDRKESISYAKKSTRYITYPSPMDANAAEKQGRGLQLAVIHFDEIAFINYNWIVVPAATNSSLAAAEQARKAGIPSPIMYTTTAGNPDTRMGAYALATFESAAIFTEKYYDLPNRETVIAFIKRNCVVPDHPMLYMEFSYKQLGKTDAWFREAAARSGASQDAINRDLLNIWQGSTENSVLPQSLISKIRESKRPPAHTDLSDGFVVSWYVDEEILNMESFRSKPLVMGMDTSENVGRDFTTFTIIDPEDMKVIATCRCNEVNLMQIGRHVFTLLSRFPKLLFIPERNNTGIAIIDFVLEELQKHRMNPYFRIYNEVIQNYDDPKYKSVDVYNYGDIYGKVRSCFGFRTTGSATSTQGSRNILYKSTMMKALEMNHNRIFDTHLITEFCSLQVRNGRIDHPDGGHDDTVISYLLACYVIFFGRNLQMYNIPISSVLSGVTLTGDKVDPVMKQEQLEIKRRIAELTDFINRNPSYILKQSYLRELRSLEQLVDEKITTVEPISVSQIKSQESVYQQRNGTEQSLNRFVRALGNFGRR